jgi:hypothetical protein
MVHRATSLTHGAQIRIGRTDLSFEIPPEAIATVLSDVPQPSEAGGTAATGPGKLPVESPLFAGQASAPSRSVASRQSAVMAVTFSLMLLVPIALVIYFWQVG